MGFAETRTVCSIKPITDKKTILFGVSDRLLDGSFTQLFLFFQFRIDITLLTLLMFKFFLSYLNNFHNIQKHLLFSPKT